MLQGLLPVLQSGDHKSLARVISLIENEVPGYIDLLASFPPSFASIIGITGPPGAGKSTLVDGLIKDLVGKNKKVAVLCVDPSSPFNLGALLGDRVRMSNWYTHPNVFIRSLASRGAVGGLHPKIIEISDAVKVAGFDYVIIETVGVGQSEIEIAGLADTTVVVLVPESGDVVQTMKAGLMEIADIFVVNKSDRPQADTFVNHLRLMLAPSFKHHADEIPVLKTIATEQAGIAELIEKIEAHQKLVNKKDRHYWLLAEKAYHLVQQHRMKDLYKQDLYERISGEQVNNLYHFLQREKLI